MPSLPKLALFDVDGTIAVNGKVVPEAIAGIKHIQDLGCLTSVSTGRGYIRLKDVLGAQFEQIISPEAPIIVEHGTKIVSHEGEIIFGDFFSEQETEHAVDFIRANIALCRLVWFNPSQLGTRLQVWCADDRDIEPETEYRGHYSDVFHSSIGDLRARLLASKLTNISAKLQNHVKVENLRLALTRTETNVIFQDGLMEFVKANTNKGLAVLYALKLHNLEPEDVLLAGNAINDVEMLDLGVGTTVLVGDETSRAVILSYLSSPETVLLMDSPQALGNYLSSL